TGGVVGDAHNRIIGRRLLGVAVIGALRQTVQLRAGDLRGRAGRQSVIPRLTDQDRCAQSRKPMDMMVQGWSTSLFQAWQQWSRMSWWDWNIRLESQLSRMNCQMFS